jgi:hypothetical protein
MPSLAAALLCLVMGIADGAPLTARYETAGVMENLRVRLAEIDAPEKVQAFANRSRQHLAEVCFKMQVVVKPQTTDRCGRTLVRVQCDGVVANAVRSCAQGTGRCDLAPCVARDDSTAMTGGIFVLYRVVTQTMMTISKSWSGGQPTPRWAVAATASSAVIKSSAWRT